MQARCSTANICRAIKVINVGFCYCFLIAKTEGQQEALQFEMESAFVATKYWGTQSINIYTKHNLHCPFTLFPSFFLGDSLLGASLSGNGGDLCRDTKSNNTAAQQGGRHPAAQSYYVIPGLPLTNWMLQALSINSKKTLKQEGGMWRGELHLIRTYCPGSLGKVVYLLSPKLNTVVIMSRVFLFFSPKNQKVNTGGGGANKSHAGFASTL